MAMTDDSGAPGRLGGSPLGAPVSSGGPKPLGTPSQVTAESDRTSPTSPPCHAVTRRQLGLVLPLHHQRWKMAVAGASGGRVVGPRAYCDPGSCFFLSRRPPSFHGEHPWDLSPQPLTVLGGTSLSSAYGTAVSRPPQRQHLARQVDARQVDLDHG